MRFSPVVITAFVVAFALFTGAIIMNFSGVKLEDSADFSEEVVIKKESIDNPLKESQIDYILDRISLEEYLEKEKEFLG